jgi:hypothetical protein
MAGQLLEGLLSREPALATALATLVAGFTAQIGPGQVGSLRALGTSTTVSGLQGLLTRANVISPASFNRGLSNLSPSALLAHGAEPALWMSLLGTFAGFLVQIVGPHHPNLLKALGIAGGMAVTQGLVTRQQVYSPRTVALGRLASGAGAETFTGAVPPAVKPAAPPSATVAPAAPAPAAPAALDTEAGREALLARFCPVVRYDSMESYYADAAEIIPNRPGNVLMSADRTTQLAPGRVAAQLTIDVLQGGHYQDGTPVQSGDFIKETGSDYVAQAQQMHANPQYADRVHGRAIQDHTGTWWLQYWFFMYYDDPGFLGFGVHEGDLEMIQLRLDPLGNPNAASYSQHRSGVRPTWDQLEKAITADGLVPVTYSARGSHANLLRAGTSISTRSFLPDHNDGQGHRVRPQLVVLSDAAPAWAQWTGSWGGTKAPPGILGQIGIDANSPTAPNRHLAWSQPDVFHASCDPPPDDLPAPGQPAGTELARPPAPQLTIEQDPQGTLVHYAVPPDGTAPAAAKIVASLVSKDPSVPAHTVSADVTGSTGTVRLPAAPPGTEVRATVHTETGVGSATARADT